MRRLRIVPVLLLTVVSIVASSALPPADSGSSDYAALRKQAERLIEEHSYKLALETYQKLSRASLSEEDRRWLDFRLADLAWRSAPEGGDPTIFEESTRALEKLLRDERGNETRDRVWAEAQESLGDMAWTRPNSRNWGGGWQHYAQALDWWAGARDLEQARRRYLSIVWKASRGEDESYMFGYYASNIPADILENAVKIATTANEKSQANYLLAIQMMGRGDPDSVERTRKVFDAALAAGRSSAWYDDALFHYAQWLESTGRLLYQDDGQFRTEPDYEGAVALYRRFLAEYQQGESRFRDQAKARLDAIIQPSVTVAVSNVFLPGSKVQFNLSHRNVTEIEFSLVKVDLTTDITNWDSSGISGWYGAIDAARGRDRISWKHTAKVTGKYAPGSEQVEVEKDLPPGAWLLEARGGTKSARDLVLVTEAAAVARTSAGKSLVWVTDARTGEPLPGARVSVWQQVYEQGTTKTLHRKAQTDANGLADIVLPGPPAGPLLVLAAAGEHQAFVQPYSPGGNQPEEEWRIYATTDRPAYRPGETAQWKITARLTSNYSYTVPSDREITYEIRDARGTSVDKGTLKLNAFGSAWSELALTPSMTLGEYRVDFQNAKGSIGSAVLFRIEEYKLPEFRVDVKPELDGDKPRLYRPGDEVDVVVQASYYFGGPVANATVEAVVYQTPYYRWWIPEREYPWYFEQQNARQSYYRGSEPIVKRETLKTDGEGKARLRFDTPVGAGQDFEYRIEVRVTDASRREISGQNIIRVTRSPFFADAKPKHWLYKPGEKVEIRFRTVDANDQPVSAAGTLRVTREEWKEVWLDPKGNEVTGKPLELIRSRGAFPPSAEANQHPWLLIRRGYEQEEVSKSTVKTDSKGAGVFQFTPQKEGYYRFIWSSHAEGADKPRPRDIVSAETAIWVASSTTTRLGYFHQSGVQIVLDEEMVRPGATLPVMIIVPTADRHVLFSVEGEDIMSRQVIRTNGNVKLLELKLSDQHIPNVFLTASMVMDLQLHQDTKELIVPPVEKFLTVDVKSDRNEYQPQEEGTLTITTRDADGKPVAAEVSLGVSDESVLAIQQDYAGDSRQFFYGRKRSHAVQTASSFNYKSYIRLVAENGQLVDERLSAKLRDGELNAGGKVGGAAGDSRKREDGARQEPKNGAYRQNAADSVAEAITVAAAAPPVSKSAMLQSEGKEKDQFGGGTGEAAVQVRSDFRSTILWKPDIITNDRGMATITLKYPDALTTWRATARAGTKASQFGQGASSSRTKKPLIVRLQNPRFFVVGDQTVVSAVINNNTDDRLTVTPQLEAAGLEIVGVLLDGKTTAGKPDPVVIDANGEGRVDWLVAVRVPGSARLRVTARGGNLSDAMERTYPVEDHGIDKLVAVSGKVRGDESTLRLVVPSERRSTSMNVQVTPSLAVTMLDALPYLIDYPYGCTEQTMSRFLPAVIVSKTLNDLGLSREMVASRIFGGIEAAHIDKTQPKGKKDLQKLDEMVRAGLSRLYDFQHSDGGWGWWKEGESDHHMSAYVVWGLAMAREAGISVRSGVIERGVDYLQRELVEEENNPDRQAWMLHALSATSKGRSRVAFEQAAVDNLWKKRDRLSSYGLALFALSAHQYGLKEQALTLARNLENGAAIDKAPDTSILIKGSGSGAESVMATAHWGSRGSWWQWYDSPVESTSLTLRALVAIDPKHRLIEPSMNWLVKNRRGAQWSNTRDTALTVLALNEYLRTSGELGGDVDYEVLVNGKQLVTRKVAAKDILSAPSRFVVPDSSIRDGENLITIRRTRGTGALYVGAEARFFSLEEPVKAAGNEIFVKRQYTRQVGRPTLLKGYVYDAVPLTDSQSIRSGERVDVVLTVEVKNDYEYLLLEDLKPAGLEAVEIVSGTPLYAQKLKSSVVEDKHGTRSASKKPSETVLPEAQDSIGTRFVYRELRDRKVALFIDKLEQGVWEIRYSMRAEVPGRFHALPLLGGAMYVPEIRGNSDEIRITVEDR